MVNCRMRLLTVSTVFLFLSCVGTIQSVPTPPCAAVFNPVPELESQSLAAADRWRAASGCEPSIDDKGIPVVSGYQFWYDGIGGPVATEPFEGARPLCGYWDATIPMIYISLADIDNRYNCDGQSLEDVILHEMGHALTAYGRQGGHADTGIMAPGAIPTESRTKINTDTLGWFCSRANCLWFVPEVP